jgi:hypothetical protein
VVFRQHARHDHRDVFAQQVPPLVAQEALYLIVGMEYGAHLLGGGRNNDDSRRSVFTKYGLLVYGHRGSLFTQFGLVDLEYLLEQGMAIVVVVDNLL